MNIFIEGKWWSYHINTQNPPRFSKDRTDHASAFVALEFLFHQAALCLNFTNSREQQPHAIVVIHQHLTNEQ